MNKSKIGSLLFLLISLVLIKSCGPEKIKPAFDKPKATRKMQKPIIIEIDSDNNEMFYMPAPKIAQPIADPMVESGPLTEHE